MQTLCPGRLSRFGPVVRGGFARKRRCLSGLDGGYRREGTFIEYAKNLVDRLHAWYSFEPARFQVDALTRSTYALHFYDSVLVMEKRPMSEPRQDSS